MSEIQKLWSEFDIRVPKKIKHTEQGDTFVRFTHEGKNYQVSIQEINSEKKTQFWKD